MSKNGQKKSLAEVDDKTEKNRLWLAEHLELSPAQLSDSAVRFVMKMVPEPETWKNRILIAMSLGELGYSRFWQYMHRVRWFGWHIDHGRVVTNSGQYLPDSHNTIINNGALRPEKGGALLQMDWDYILFLEHDHEFPENLLEIVATYTDPIVGGLYFNRVVEDPQPVAYNWNHQRTAIARLQPYQLTPMITKPGLYEVDVVPMGCTAIRRDVLEQWPLDLPWFHSATSPKNGKSMSDDVFFCKYAQEMGWTIKLDTRIIPKHYAIVPFDERFYYAWVAQMSREGKTKPVEEIVVPT